MFFLVVTFSLVKFPPTFCGRIKNVFLSSPTLVFCFTARFYRDFDSIYCKENKREEKEKGCLQSHTQKKGRIQGAAKG